MNSLTYYITASVIKLKGIKKIFSEDPINYQKLRKDDIHEPSSKDVFGVDLNSTHVGKSKITQLVPKEIKSEKVILYCHGGASVYGPTAINWNSIARIVKKASVKAYLIDYPKAPEYQISEINYNIDEVYSYLLKKHEAKNIILLGDSWGGTLLVLLVQRLLNNKQPLPNSIMLISPVMDCSFSNPNIKEIDSKDIMLSKVGVISAKKMCSGSLDLNNKAISPLFGSFKNFITTYIFIGENDIMRPDEELFVQQLLQENVKVEVYIGKEMPHIWVFLPLIYEGRVAMKKIIQILSKK